MYDQIVLRNQTFDSTSGGSADLPSIVSFNGLPRDIDSSDWNGGGSVHSDIGTIGNNIPEYALEFQLIDSVTASNALNLSSWSTSLVNPANIYDIYKKVRTNYYLDFLKSYFNRFYVYSIPDYGMQAMTAKNYDVVIKIFDSAGNLIIPYRIAYLRSYTSKKIFVLVEMTVGNSSSQPSLSSLNLSSFTAVISFRNRMFSASSTAEGLYGTTLVSRFADFPDSDLSTYFDSSNSISPYYDEYSISNSDNTILHTEALGKQQNYFGYIQDETINSENSDKTSPVPNSFKNISIKKQTLRNSSTESNSYTEESIISVSDVSSYLNKNMYEIYSYTKAYSTRTASRIFDSTSTNSSYNYIVYENRPDVIHYCLKVSASFTESDISGITDENEKEAAYIHSYMKYANMYLWDYDFGTNYAIFSGAGKLKYDTGSLAYGDIIDIYIHIPRDGGEYDSKYSIPSSITEASETFSATAMGDTDYSSIYDPDTMEEDSVYDSGSINYLPYLGNDSYIASSLVDNEIEIISSDLFIFDVRDQTELVNDKFDIMPFSSTATPAASDTISSSFVSGRKSDLNDQGYRDWNNSDTSTNAYKLNSAITEIDGQLVTISKNIEKLIPSTAVYTSLNAGGTITTLNSDGTKNCLAIAIKKNDSLFTNGKLELTCTVADGKTYTLNIYSANYSTINDIIIAPQDNQKSFTIPKAVSYYLVR